MNYYVFDQIVFDNGCYWGYRGEAFVEVFQICDDDTDERLAEKGFAKCDAPGTETFVVSETDMEALS